MTVVDRPDRIVRTLLLSVTLWVGVGLAVLGGFALIFPSSETTMPHVSGVVPASCTPTVLGPFDPLAASDLAGPILAASSGCGADATPTPESLLHAYLEGAELDGSPTGPAPALDAALLARGAALYRAHCKSCHGATGDGSGPNACVLQTRPAVHKLGVFALRSTEHEALPTDEDIFRTITRGVHGTAMPPWLLLPEQDRWALVASVKSLSKQFEEDTAPPSVDLGHVPAVTLERLARGHELYMTGGCASCHGEHGRGDGPAAASFSVRPRDFTHGRFHRGSSATDIHATLVTGLDGTPMASFAKVLSTDDMWNVALYVHSLTPPLVERNGVHCPAAPSPLDGQEVFGIRNVMSTLGHKR